MTKRPTDTPQARSAVLRFRDAAGNAWIRTPNGYHWASAGDPPAAGPASTWTTPTRNPCSAGNNRAVSTAMVSSSEHDWQAMRVTITECDYPAFTPGDRPETRSGLASKSPQSAVCRRGMIAYRSPAARRGAGYASRRRREIGTEPHRSHTAGVIGEPWRVKPLVAAHCSDDKMQAEPGAARGGQFLCQGVTVRVRPHVVVDALHQGHVVAALGDLGFHDSDVAVTIESTRSMNPRPKLPSTPAGRQAGTSRSARRFHSDE